MLNRELCDIWHRYSLCMQVQAVAKLYRGNAVDLPAENGRKASLRLNLPSASRKCSGLNVFGVSHSLSSNRTDVRVPATKVP